jgi:hypothetical protein
MQNKQNKDAITDEVQRVKENTEKKSCLRRGFVVDRLLELRVRIPAMLWISFSCECCLLSGRGSQSVHEPCLWVTRVNRF